ncbi:hypothetical protein WJX81_001301 [Elliptochloris bilobata]|uniref:F-box domain-containing protein n=1 Tax=Elliptochloris bilobata TaxID=381761 RepID=A0AAW1RXH5_9CHLO
MAGSSPVVGDGLELISTLPAGALHHVFDYLGPRDLCAVGATCRGWHLLQGDAAANQAWSAFYEKRWAAPAGVLVAGVTWQARYGRKLRTQAAYGGRARADNLFGHRAGVRCLGLLPGRNLLVTGSADKTVRLWSLDAGMPLATSRCHSGTVRALALDEHLLVSASNLDGALRVWRAEAADAGVLFDLQRATRLYGHQGPVTTVAVDETCIYSGSWDYSVRMWSRSRLTETALLSYDDWVWSVCPRVPHLLVAAGSLAVVHDLGTGRILRRYVSCARAALHSPRVEGTRDGRLLFCGNAEGAVLAYDLRIPSEAPAASLWTGGAIVHALSFDDPYLAAALGDGSLALVNVDQAMRGGRGSSPRGGGGGGGGPAARQFPGSGRPAYCVELRDQWMASGGESEVVRCFDFTGAMEAAERAQAGRAARNAAAAEGQQ